MKANITFIALMFAAVAVMAQEEAPKPDYSRDTLMRLLVAEEQYKRPAKVEFHVGAVEFRALGTRWRFNYLPLMMPLPGTRFTTTREWPDAFSLTGTAIATPPRAWRTKRELNAELKRIDRLTKVKATVKVTTD